MAPLYFDNDVSLRLAPLLGDAGHICTTALDLGLPAAGDEVQLLTAVQRGAIFITYNRWDFMLLHRAWLLWPPAFGFALPPHPGILTVDQVELPRQLGALLTLFSAVATERLSNQMFWWHAPIGWRVLNGTDWTRFEV